MKRAVIATLFNEVDNVADWWRSLLNQTAMPDEFAIVDGGSTDGTWEQLQQLTKQTPVPIKLQQRKCNIAQGRNLAIASTSAEIIAVTDSGSLLEPNWLDEITRPLMENECVDATGGLNISSDETDFQKFLAHYEKREESGLHRGQLNPSSRNTAFRRQAWIEVGGYPEWLTLAGEDALFTMQMNRVGHRFQYCPKAIVHWSMRENERDYFKLLYRNAYGAAEGRFGWPYFRQRLLVSLFPPLLLLSRYRLKLLRFRYLKNFYSAYGWMAGRWLGQRPPKGWCYQEGLFLSPESQRKLAGVSLTGPTSEPPVDLKKTA